MVATFLQATEFHHEVHGGALSSTNAGTASSDAPHRLMQLPRSASQQREGSTRDSTGALMPVPLGDPGGTQIQITRSCTPVLHQSLSFAR